MKIYNKMLIKVAFVDTDLGDFKITRGGGMERWHEDLHEYKWFDGDKYEPEDLRAIRQAGLELLQ